MNPRFVALTFGACTIVFAGVWAITAPAGTPAPAAAATTEPATLYADCDAVRAAGAAPLRAGQPGYRPALDPNMNGIACETVGAADARPPMTNAPAPSEPSPPPPNLPPPPPVPDLGPPPAALPPLV